MNNKFELMVQRMVDNELDENQRADFLKLAEANPELWRETTLAFVEDRVWSSAVIGQHHDSVDLDDLKKGAGTRQVSRDHRNSWWLRYGPQLLITAASVMLVFSLALRFNPVDRSQEKPLNNGIAAKPADPPIEQDRLGPDGSQLASQPYRLKVNENFDVPIYEDRERFRQELIRLAQLSPDVLEQFKAAGFHVQPEIRYISGNSRDGRPFIVPIQSLLVRRIGQ